MSYGRQQRLNWASGRFGALFAKRSVQPGEHFGAPGQGSAAAIATGTVVALLLLWVVVSNSGLVKPLFLPSPQAVFQQFYEYLTGTLPYDGKNELAILIKCAAYNAKRLVWLVHNDPTGWAR